MGQGDEMAIDNISILNYLWNTVDYTNVRVIKTSLSKTKVVLINFYYLRKEYV